MTGENTRVLVVDDEEIVRESLGGWLQEDGLPGLLRARRALRRGAHEDRAAGT